MGSTLASSYNDEYCRATWSESADASYDTEPLLWAGVEIEPPKKSKEEQEKDDLLKLIDDLEKTFKEHMKNYSRKNRKKMVKWYGRRMFQ